jgi:hypothetical protein
MDDRVGSLDGSDHVPDVAAIAHAQFETGMAVKVADGIVPVNQTVYDAHPAAEREQLPDQASADVAGAADEQHDSFFGNWAGKRWSRTDVSRK